MVLWHSLIDKIVKTVTWYVFLGLPAYYNTPEFVLGIKQHYNQQPQASVRFGHGVILPPVQGPTDLHHKELHEPLGHSEHDVHNELHTESGETHESIASGDLEEDQGESHHHEGVDEHGEHEKKSSLPEFTSNRDTMLLQVCI